MSARGFFVFAEGIIMTEKKRQYSRALAQKRCLEAIERAILINKSEAESPFVFQVQELVVFGPLVDTDAPAVHGVDILATTARHHRYRNRDEAFHSDSEDFIMLRRKTPCFSYGDIRRSETKFLLKG